MKKKFLRYLSLVMVIIIMMSTFAIDVSAAKKEKTLATPKVSISLLSTPAIKISWSKVNDADMYYVYRSTTSKGSLKLYAKTEKLYYKDTDVKENGKYYYKVKAVSLNSKGKVTKRSDTSKMVSKTFVNIKAPTLTVKNLGEAKVSLSWNKVEGVNRYYMYYSTSKNGTYKSIGYVNSDITSYTLSNLDSLTKYYFKVKSAKVINGKVYKSDYSKVKSAKTNGKNGEYIVEFEKITNEEVGYPSGSPMVCLAMMMRHYGIDVTPKELFEYVEIREPYKKGNQVYVDSYISDVYIGDPTKEKSPLGNPCIYTTVIYDFITYCKAHNITNIVGNIYLGYYDKFEEVKEYIKQGNIIVCAIEEDKNPKTMYVNYKDKNSITTEYSCDTKFSTTTKYMLLCGYTDTDYIFYDPSDNKYKSYKAENELFAGFIPLCTKEYSYKKRKELFGY